jgi:PTH1 family peptidyl-tRNA hydrolase
LHLIVGLGNPGAAYARTRHNAGLWVVERAAHRWSIHLIRQGTAIRGSGRLGSEPVELAGALGWMNLSGTPIKGLLRELNLDIDGLVVVHDDLDLEPGRLRIKQNGGHGGHNGIRSILDVLGTGQFVRVKIGIGRPPGGLGSVEYVLERVTPAELDVIEPCVDRAVDALEVLIHRGAAAAMNQFNVRDTVREQDSDS